MAGNSGMDGWAWQARSQAGVSRWASTRLLLSTLTVDPTVWLLIATTVFGPLASTAVMLRYSPKANLK